MVAQTFPRCVKGGTRRGERLRAMLSLVLSTFAQQAVVNIEAGGRVIVSAGSALRIGDYVCPAAYTGENCDIYRFTDPENFIASGDMIDHVTGQPAAPDFFFANATTRATVFAEGCTVGRAQPSTDSGAMVSRRDSPPDVYQPWTDLAVRGCVEVVSSPALFGGGALKFTHDPVTTGNSRKRAYTTTYLWNGADGSRRAARRQAPAAVGQTWRFSVWCRAEADALVSLLMFACKADGTGSSTGEGGAVIPGTSVHTLRHDYVVNASRCVADSWTQASITWTIPDDVANVEGVQVRIDMMAVGESISRTDTVDVGGEVRQYFYTTFENVTENMPASSTYWDGFELRRVA